MSTKELQQLNQDTFDAEEQKAIGGETWAAFLGRVLADDFRIRRSDPTIALQDRAGMIAWIQNHAVVPKQLADVKVFEDGNYGVVTCVVTLQGQPGQFHNLKVFHRESPSGDWRCSYWQVSKV